MSILITGAAGSIGEQVMDWARTRLVRATPLDMPNDLFAWAGDAETVVHLAWDPLSPERTYDMARHMLTTARLKRFILASSISVDPACGLREVDEFHVAAKLGAELWARAWARTTGGTAIAMRFGHCIRGSEPPADHEALRLKAMGPQPRPGDLTVWNAVGNGGVRTDQWEKP